jgi:hypothetical protein
VTRSFGQQVSGFIKEPERAATREDVPNFQSSLDM